MIDHRRIQRTLFRMQLDPAFAAAVVSGEAAEPGLGAAEAAMLRNAGLAGVLADHRGRRRAQVLGNVASEYVLTLAEAGRSGLGPDLLHDFPRSEAFHAAIRAEEPLPLAFGAWLSVTLAASSSGLAAAFAGLESAMARARRVARPEPAPAQGRIVLSAQAWLVTLPDGAFDHAQAARAALDAGSDPPPPPEEVENRAAKWLTATRAGAAPDSSRLETVLLVVSERGGGHRLRDVAPERLEPEVASLLRAAESPLGTAEIAALAEARGWELADVGAFVDQLVSDGVLRRG